MLMTAPLIVLYCNEYIRAVSVYVRVQIQALFGSFQSEKAVQAGRSYSGINHSRFRRLNNVGAVYPGCVNYSCMHGGGRVLYRHGSLHARLVYLTGIGRYLRNINIFLA